MIEPMVQLQSPGGPDGPNAARLTSSRSDLWPSRVGAEVSLRRNAFFRAWDPRALIRYLQVGPRNVPTALYPISAKAPAGSVTLTTTKAREAWSYVRSNFSPQAQDPFDPVEQLLGPDLNRRSTEGYLSNCSYLTNRTELNIVF